MTDDTQYPDGTETNPDNHQHAVEACQHALDALRDDNLSATRSLLDEARTAVERAQHDDTEQAYREIAYDCYN